LEAIAEIVSASITSFTAESLRQDGEWTSGFGQAGFGSFVSTRSSEGETQSIAVVHDMATEPIDGVHRTSAFGLDRAQLRLEQPQIFELLRTNLHATIVAHKRNGQIYPYLPPQPPALHDFVYICAADEVEAATSNFEFLRLLCLKAGPADELLAAALREAYLATGKRPTFLQKGGQALSQIFRADYDRLISVLRKIKPTDVD
jgi:hypothetical protein